MGSIRLSGWQETPSKRNSLDGSSTRSSCKIYRDQRYVALKALRADSSDGSRDIFEGEILSKISEVSAKSTHEGRHFVLPSLHQFKHKGPNGEHLCFIFDVLGHHLDFQCSNYKDWKLPVRAVKIIAYQLLQGLDFLHRECGVIHTDLKPSNILLELDTQQETISKYLSEVPPRTDPECEVEVPLREAITTPLISEMEEPRTRIIDFGFASWREKHLVHLIQPTALRSPEVTIGAPWDTAVDIWSLGCLIIEFVQGIIPFRGQASKFGTWSVDDDRLARTIEILGPFPAELLKKGKHTSSFFNENGNLHRISNLKPTNIEGLINGAKSPFLKPYDMPDSEVPIFVDFLQKMLTIDPALRSSASNLLQHEWIK
ncbi:hypothetical protein FQN53_003827 [Emmonsiellopsis sp. PD_33]|nr:hypothetical protein FQN53_003827 [Emmonsiellopsis sp. PD_33]